MNLKHRFMFSLQGTPPDMSRRSLVTTGAIGAALSGTALYFLFPYALQGFGDGFYRPLVEDGPVIMISWGVFAAPGLAIGLVLALLLCVSAFLKGLRIPVPDWGRVFVWTGILSIILMIPGAKGGMWAASYHVTHNLGYEYCSALSRYEIGVGDRAYVKHRALCYRPSRG